jgi:tRNA A-37 threonylcarbamoyl transferase component Bud32
MRPLRNVNTPSNVTTISHVTRRGHVIGERYRLEKPLERGAMGTVWCAQHVRLKAPVAVKFLDPSLIGDSEMHDRFMQEARSAAAVRSAHVVQVFDYGSEGGVPYIVMELLDGENLDSRLSRTGALSPAELNKIFGEIARGIGKAHSMGVVHRDLKPGNIFIAREGDHEVTKLVDFGIAKVKSDALKFTQNVGTQLGTLLGTPQYMSPEQVRGSTSVDHRTDLWALGIMACECLTGQYPFSGRSIGDLTVQICTEKPTAPSLLGPVPPGFDQWFFKATSKKRSKRFASADEMAEALSAILTVTPAGAAAAGWNWSLPLPSRERVRFACTAVIARLERQATWLAAFARVALDHLRVALDHLRVALDHLRTSWDKAAHIARALPVSAKVMASGGLAMLCLAFLVRWQSSPSPSPSQAVAVVARPLEPAPVAAAPLPSPEAALPSAEAALPSAESAAASFGAQPHDPPVRPIVEQAAEKEIRAPEAKTTRPAAAPVPSAPPNTVEVKDLAPVQEEPEDNPVPVSAPPVAPRPAPKPPVTKPVRTGRTPPTPQRDPSPVVQRDARLELARAALATAKAPTVTKEQPVRAEQRADSDPRRKTAPRSAARAPASSKVNPFADRL